MLLNNQITESKDTPKDTVHYLFFNCPQLQGLKDNLKMTWITEVNSNAYSQGFPLQGFTLAKLVGSSPNLPLRFWLKFHKWNCIAETLGYLLSERRISARDKRHLLKVFDLPICTDMALEFLGPYFLASNRNLRSPLSQILFEKFPQPTGAQ